VFGDYVLSSTKESGKNADQVFKELQDLYGKIASTTPYRLSAELKPPVEIVSSALEMTPKEYRYTAKTEHDSKNVIITSPLKWVLNYSGFNPGRLQNMLSHRDRNSEEIRQHLLHHLIMHSVVTNQTGVTQILSALQFPIGTEYEPELGEMPLTYVSSAISTIRPPDHIIIENTEISGMDAFEEVVNLSDIAQMKNPLKDSLIELVKSHSVDLLP
jgi:hypothetical protein